MVNYQRFYPEGYTSSEQAAVLLARLCFPDKWSDEVLLPNEDDVWAGIGRDFHADSTKDALHNLARSNSRSENISNAIDRLEIFAGAFGELQRQLFAGNIVADYCNEHGKIVSIEKETWGKAGAKEFLRNGIAVMPGLDHRLILLPIEQLRAVARTILKTRISDEPQKANFTGRGKAERLIISTFAKLFPNGLPDGLSSQKRDEAIREEIKSQHDTHSVPNVRTIQKALKKMREK